MVKILIPGLFLLAIFACSVNRQKNNTVKDMSFDKQGHRGCRGLMPENTIPAMLKAIDLGVTTLEMDVVISKDLKVVVSHDPYFHENITTTPEGTALKKSSASSHALYSMNYDSIKKYDVGLKLHPNFPKQQKIAVYKPLLSELIEASEAYAKKNGRKINYNIEIKSSVANDGKMHPPVAEFVHIVMKVIESKGIKNNTTIQSFDFRALQVMHQKYPEMTTALLMEATDKRSVSQQITDLGFTPMIYSPHYSIVTAEVVKLCHGKKIKVIPWTVNTVTEMKTLIALGVDGIISDYPDLLASL